MIRLKGMMINDDLRAGEEVSTLKLGILGHRLGFAYLKSRD